MNNPKIRIRKKIIDRIFPDEFTKMRPEDFTNKAIDNEKILNKREKEALINFRTDMGNRHYSGGFEFMAKKNKNKIEFVRID